MTKEKLITTTSLRNIKRIMYNSIFQQKTQKLSL